jgi:hypothetical protein
MARYRWLAWAATIAVCAFWLIAAMAALTVIAAAITYARPGH